MHAFNILRRGLEAHQDDPFAAGGGSFGRFGRKVHFAGRRTGRCRQAVADDLARRQGVLVEGRMEQLVQGFRLDPQQGLFRRDHAFVDEVAGDVDGRFGRAFAVAGLQEIELAFLDGEFHILHIAVMGFQLIGQADEFAVAVRQVFRQFRDRLRRAYAGDHVFALGVDQVFAVDAPGARGGIARERDARARRAAHVAKDHGLHVDGRTPVPGDVVHPAVHIGARVVPGTEDGLDRFQQLRGRLLREILVLRLSIDVLEALHELLHIVHIQVDVVLDALLLLDFVDDLLKPGFRDLHDHIGEHLDEAPVRVVGKARILRLLCQPFDGYIVQAQVQDGVHHARHGDAGPAADGNQERVVRVAEHAPVLLFQPAHGLEDLPLDLIGNPLPRAIVVRAGLRRDREALGDRQPQIRHFGEVRPLAAQQLAHLRVAFEEPIDPFFSLCHVCSPLSSCLAAFSVPD